MMIKNEWAGLLSELFHVYDPDNSSLSQLDVLIEKNKTQSGQCVIIICTASRID